MCGKQYRDFIVLAFCFVDRNDESLHMEKINNKLHPKMVNESHNLVVREPIIVNYGNLKLNVATRKASWSKRTCLF